MVMQFVHIETTTSGSTSMSNIVWVVQTPVVQQVAPSVRGSRSIRITMTDPDSCHPSSVLVGGMTVPESCSLALAAV